ncbi:hypothetical protein EMIHUDRAFT_237777 [Emiliania huxleyi CCMP1516]|uniref:Uncharacterized protein n=2 Tax=Emiliania huxleyi TaxID=2903 RepID=A0A0D3JPC0_EMIH1|nr:hypothetical protein EMIHUDRAFT_237777 [Emiliania huxleyi CCMP1516]EOD25355.1 hypothetical protein EMIHUDRAFT_237777 [Emiliania huxleyi CCMP1516]|eukprot:XP_005777784.1 hypothetical protein EMIHUDRAFT_237777 [Emiliania huxleyi CCMP1516]
MGYKAGTRADPNAITPQQARTAFARYCKKIDVTKEELAWNFGCISASQNNEQEAVLVRELILSNNKRLEERGREEANATCAEDEDINWDDAAEGIGEGIEGPEGFRDSDDDDEERGGDGGATRRRSEIANGPSREGDGGARGNNGDATDDANRGTDAGGDGEGDSDVEVDATVSRAPPKKGRTAMEVTEWRANGTMRKGRARRMEKETAPAGHFETFAKNASYMGGLREGWIEKHSNKEEATGGTGGGCSDGLLTKALSKSKI